jgi:quercetin dioxygenase-like cupin family protein
LRADGDDEVLNREVGAGQAVPEHTHGFEVHILMLESEFVLERSGETRRYGPGEVFEVSANARHAESFGPTGAAYLAGPRHNTGAPGT